MELFSVMKGCGYRSNSHDTVQLGYVSPLSIDTLEDMERDEGRKGLLWEGKVKRRN